MTGLVCLQGGGEFSPGCRAMDAAVLEQSAGPVVVTGLAGESGRDYRTATDNGVRHLQALTRLEVLAAPDAREDRAGALQALAAAGTVVLPGGSPSRLLHALQTTGIADLLAGLLARGGTVIGASAGAIVLCAWTVLPDRGGSVSVEPGLGLVPGLLVVPHWTGSGRSDWLQAVERAVPSEVRVLGLAEESGVLVREGAVTAVGRSSATLVSAGRELLPGSTERMP